MRKTAFTLILVLLLSLPGISLAKSVVVIGWDGAGYRNLIPLLEAGYLPAVSSILDVGGKFLFLETLYDTSTATTWCNGLIAGQTPDQTGISSNRSRAKLAYEDTIIYFLKNYGYKTGMFPSIYFLWTRGPLKRMIPYLDAGALVTGVDNEGNCIVGAEFVAAEKAVQFIVDNRGQDFFLFLHVGPDCYGHRFGENSPEYLNNFISTDQVVQRVLNVIDPDTAVLLMNDHGFNEDENEHGSAPDLWLVASHHFQIKEIYFNGQTRGTVRDVFYTILDYLEIGWPDDYSKYRGKSLLKDE